MNNFKVEIWNSKENKFIDFTSHAVFPLKLADLLDEQLDECEITIKRVLLEHINPLTRVKITITNNPKAKFSQHFADIKSLENKDVQTSYNPNTKRITQTFEKEFIVANDYGIEQPVGSKKYNHQLYLIETTKILEGYIGDSITFTNPLGNSYDGRSAIFTKTGVNETTDYFTNSWYKTNDTSPLELLRFDYFIVLQAGLNYEEYVTNSLGKNFWVEVLDVDNKIIYRQEAFDGLYNSGVYEFDKDNPYDYSFPFGNPLTGAPGGRLLNNGTDFKYYNSGNSFVQKKLNLPLGTYKIRYAIGSTSSNDGSVIYSYKAETTISIVENKLPLKKWTITDVINRIFDTVIPLFDNEKPKFKLSGVKYDEFYNPSGYEEGSTAEKLDKIISPEMTFTKMTLREMLKQVGGFIHGEPRIVKINEDFLNTGDKPKLEYIIDFDFYGSNQYSNISKRNQVSGTLRTDINEFCTSIDTSANNLVNRLDWANGVIIEPFVNGKKSVRCETTFVRMEENNSTVISTEFPIDTVYKIEWVSTDNESYDITKYLFESAHYDNLSSYDGNFPHSKAEAIYYTYGKQNIKGLFFKSEHAINSIFHNYSIKNIIKNASGKDVSNYMILSFRVSYLPIGSARIVTNKQTVINGIPRTLAYNQDANLIESRYFGENLKGVVARLGNVEKTYTYNLAFLSDIPKVGTLFDDNYYISTVNTEILPVYIRCTVALSKDFNRLSQHIGISSEKRMWEVSERQAFNRETVINSMVVISEKESFEFTKEHSFIEGNVDIANVIFNKLGSTPAKNFVSIANVRRSTKKGASISPDILSLPVLSYALGNSMLFSIRFEDNYSAGQKSLHVDGKADDDGYDSVTGYWGTSVPYCDYYGRFYYLAITIGFGIRNSGLTLEENNKLDLPDVFINSDERFIYCKLKYRKDSREVPTITMCINFVTDNPSIIIGSALAKNCSAVNQNPKEYELYVFNHRLNSIDSTIDFNDAIKINEEFSVSSNNITLPAIATEHKSWAIVTKRETTYLRVEDDDGDPVTQEIHEGGELVLGGNEPLTNGKTLYFHIGRDVYD